MRIIGGERRGMKLITSKIRGVRPTMDIARESLMNLIGPIDSEARVLDLFGGTGAVGIEFLSRGAGHVTIGELKRANCEIIQQNLQKAYYEDRARIVPGNFENTLALLNEECEKFDYVFIDPPYATNYSEKALSILLKCGILNEGAQIIVERESKDVRPVDAQGLDLAKDRIYGTARFLFYQVEESHESHLSG